MVLSVVLIFLFHQSPAMDHDGAFTSNTTAWNVDALGYVVSPVLFLFGLVAYLLPVGMFGAGFALVFGMYRPAYRLRMLLLIITSVPLACGSFSAFELLFVNGPGTSGGEVGLTICGWLSRLLPKSVAQLFTLVASIALLDILWGFHRKAWPAIEKLKTPCSILVRTIRMAAQYSWTAIVACATWTAAKLRSRTGSDQVSVGSSTATTPGRTKPQSGWIGTSSTPAFSQTQSGAAHSPPWEVGVPSGGALDSSLLPDVPPELDRPLPLQLLNEDHEPGSSTRSGKLIGEIRQVMNKAIELLHRIKGLRMEPSDLPEQDKPALVVGMSAAVTYLKAVAGQRLPVKKVIRDSLEEIGFEVGRSPVRMIDGRIPGEIGLEFPLRDYGERRYCPAGQILVEVMPSDPVHDPMTIVFGRKQESGEIHQVELSENSGCSGLLSGSTRSGKTSLLHSIDVSLFFRYPPSRVGLLIYDGKGTEFTRYQDVPHVIQLARNVDDGVIMIRNVGIELDRRNAVWEETDEDFRTLLLQIDEPHDLPPEALAQVVRIASMGVARRIVTWVSLQVAAAEKVPTLLKGNLSHRVAFHLPSQAASRMILDGVAGSSAATALMDKGDCLVTSQNLRSPVRLQAGWVSPGTQEAIALYCRSLMENEDEARAVV